jgi:hypothetical protein
MNVNSKIDHISIQNAIDNIYSKNIKKNLDAESYLKLKKSVSLLKESKLPILDINRKINQTESFLENYKSKISNNINFLINLKSTDNFIVYMNKDGIKLEKISTNSSLLHRIKFKIKELFFNDYNVLDSLFKGASLLAKDNIEVKNRVLNSLDKLKDLRNKRTDFYASLELIQKHARLTTEINKTLDVYQSNIINENEQLIREDRINVGKKFLKNLNFSQRVQNLTGIAIAATVAVSNDNAFIDQGGNGIFSTEQERKTLNNLLKENDSTSPLSTVEKATTQQYLDDIERSQNLNFMIAALNREADPTGLRVAAKNAFEHILSLSEGQSIFMDVGYFEHSMRAQFVRKNNKIEINLFDTSGALELWVSKNLLLLLMHQITGKKEYITLSTSVSLEDFQERGRAYLEQTIAMQSLEVAKLLEQKSNYLRYMDFMRVFRSINPHGNLQTRQIPQKASNCYAQRIRASEAHCLGRALYKKVRVYTLEKIYNELRELARHDLNPEENQELDEKLKNKETFLPNELKKICNQLNKLEKYPQSVTTWYPIFAVLKHNIFKTRKK